MRKTIFFCNLVSSVVILTLSLALWIMESSMTGSPFHFLMNMVGLVVLAWSVYEMRDIHHADDLFTGSIDDSEWHLLECMLTSYREYYKDAYKGTYMYESGMRDIDGWLQYVGEMRK